MPSALRAFRESFHPLFALRRNQAVRRILRAFDVPVWMKCAEIAWPVRARALTHASALRLRGGTEPSIFALFKAITEIFRPAQFWDVGANIGYYSWLVKSWNPECRVRMFEPDPSNANLIARTLERAKLERIILRRVAASDQNCQAIFAADAVTGFSGSLEPDEQAFTIRHWSAATHRLEVESVRLDDERRASANRVELIKIDVEGHEEAVVRGSRRIIKDDQPIIIYECFRRENPVAALLAEFGYEVQQADTPIAPNAQASNFLALPPQHRSRRSRLVERWRHHALNLDL